MSSVWEKLFGNGQVPANDATSAPIRLEEEAETPDQRRAGGSPHPGRGADATSKWQKVARTFDSIGRRNEALRAQLDAIEYSFRNIEVIRNEFHDALIPIDHTLGEIERTKIMHMEAERKVEALTSAHDRLKSGHSALTLERNAMIVKQDELNARASDLERDVKAAEAAFSAARAALAERRQGWSASSGSSRTIGVACRR